MIFRLSTQPKTCKFLTHNQQQKSDTHKLKKKKMKGKSHNGHQFRKSPFSSNSLNYHNPGRFSHFTIKILDLVTSCHHKLFLEKMQSLNLKLLTDFSTGTRRFVPGRSFGTEWRQCLNLRNYNRNCRIVACSVERDGGGEGTSSSSSSSSSSDPSPSSFLSRSQTYAMLKQQMEVAAQSEVTFFFIIIINCVYFFGTIWI